MSSLSYHMQLASCSVTCGLSYVQFVMHQLVAALLNLKLMQAPTTHHAPGCSHVSLHQLVVLLWLGGRLSTKPVAKRLVIDVREFMSSLPSVLHQQGLQIVPVTLEVLPFLRYNYC